MAESGRELRATSHELRTARARVSSNRNSRALRFKLWLEARSLVKWHALNLLRHSTLRGPTLERLVEAGHSVPLVVTQPDRPRGRGMELQSPQ